MFESPTGVHVELARFAAGIWSLLATADAAKTPRSTEKNICSQSSTSNDGLPFTPDGETSVKTNDRGNENWLKKESRWQGGHRLLGGGNNGTQNN